LEAKRISVVRKKGPEQTLCMKATTIGSPDSTVQAIYRATVVANARYRSDVLNLQAMGLTYSMLLSLVPFLAVMFSVLKAFGVQNVLEPFLAQLLQPLGNAAAEVTSRIINFVDNIRVGILGAAGVAMLFYTVVTLVAKD
jgi:membrane protein